MVIRFVDHVVVLLSPLKLFS